MQPMFDAPDKEDLAEIIIDASVVRGEKKPIEKKKSAKKVA
jgi:ATP-dependent protease Clp ATPase subunit